MSATGKEGAGEPADWPEPRENPDLIGHDGAERALLEAHRSGRLAHAWLIAGPEGIGKATLAFRFARFVLAGGGEPGLFGSAADDLRVDPESTLFKRVASGGHADLVTVARSIDPNSGKLRSEIVVADVRSVSAFLHMTAAEGGWRVVIVDPADDMNRNAANALLKILEEPPARALLLLVGHNPGRVPATIRSRCRRLTLRPLDDEAVETVLSRLRPDLAPADVAILARLAEGSPGGALRLAGEGGLDLYHEMVELVSSLPRLDAAALHGLADRLARRGAEARFRAVAGLLGWWLARMIRIGAAGRGASEAQEIVPGEAACMDRLLARADLDQWVGVWEKVTRLFTRAQAVNLDRKQVVLNAFLALENVTRP
ncbi:MAG: DNA polymerase III subunit delta' [Alphaproteobacteria bacterium]